MLRAHALHTAGETAKRDLCCPPCAGRFARKIRPADFGLLGMRCCSVIAERPCRCCNPSLCRPHRPAHVCSRWYRILSPADASSWLKALAQYPERRRALVSGGLAYIPWVITQMEEVPV